MQKLVIATLLTSVSIIGLSTSAFANIAQGNGFYVDGNIGAKWTHDLQNNITNRVDNKGFGWNVTAGYQIAKQLATEVGYTGYRRSTETTAAGAAFAKTSHYAIDWVAKGILVLPRYDRLSLFGKLGAAYVHAKKTFVTGAVGNASGVRLYYGAGVSYAFNAKFALTGQWNRALGTKRTGSSDLLSIGLEYYLT